MLSCYREHPPPPALAPWLACTWERRDGGGEPVRVVPDGCIDIVWTEGRGARVVGANTTAFLVTLEPDTSVVGARMRPGAAPALLGVDGAALCDGHLALADVWAEDGRRLEQRLDAAGDQARGAVLLAAIDDRARHAALPDPLVHAAVGRLAAPDARVEHLARELAISTRQLRRRCERAVGYGPKLPRAAAAARADRGPRRRGARAGRGRRGLRRPGAPRTTAGCWRARRPRRSFDRDGRPRDEIRRMRQAGYGTQTARGGEPP